jgi:hypothetical protein
MPDLAPTTPTAADVQSASETPMFADYLDGLAELLAARHSSGRTDCMTAALDGEVSRRLRSTVPLSVRRQEGAFFTSRALAERLLANDAHLIATSPVIADAACGAGDLLLQAAGKLQIASTVPLTLKRWGQRLVGRDLNPLYVRATHLRLALLASARVGRAWRGDQGDLAEVLLRITVGDGTALNLTVPRTLVLLNPPFGATVTRQPWGEGRIARAGVFTAEIADGLPKGAELRAILPDVLRSGSNYRRWRAYVEQRLLIKRVEPVGRFDAWTDVDVFFVAASADEAGQQATWWAPAPEAGSVATVEDFFEVRVGPVVPHRDPVEGPEAPYLRAHDLPQEGEHRPGAIRLRHRGRRFRPPLVVLRRTSRPEQSRSRVIATLVRGRESVFVENHLLVCLPNDRTLASCQRLIEALADERTTSWLDQRLRCRHLTVRALREVPLPDWPMTAHA